MDTFKQHEIFEIEVLDNTKSAKVLEHLVFGGGTMLRLCIEFLIRRGVELPAQQEKQLIELQKRITLLGDKEFKVKLGSILEHDIRDYYRAHRFSYLEEKIASLLSRS